MRISWRKASTGSSSSAASSSISSASACASASSIKTSSAVGSGSVNSCWAMASPTGSGVEFGADCGSGCAAGSPTENGSVAGWSCSDTWVLSSIVCGGYIWWLVVVSGGARARSLDCSAEDEQHSLGKDVVVGGD